MPKQPPLVSKELVEWLEAVYPDRLPHDPKVPSQAEIARVMGRQDVVRKLRNLLTSQQDNILME